MVTFISVNRNMKVWGEKKIKALDGTEKNVGEKLASFAPHGSFTTDNEDLIKKLRAHGAYGKNGKGGFIEANLKKPSKSNVIQNIRSAGTAQVLDREEKLIRLGTLRAKLLKNDGSFRKDATEEEITELQEIQGELGV